MLGTLGEASAPTKPKTCKCGVAIAIVSSGSFYGRLF